ncbi:MAG TPA: formate/nitrite transporter family protein [Gemmatimonadales bacterium]
MNEPPELEDRERRKADEEEQLNADVTYEVIRREGEGELRRHPWALAYSSLAAGLSMGFSLLAQGVLRSHLPDSEWAPLVSKLGYSVGFLVVILGSQQLFTENTVTAVVPALAQRSGRLLGRMGRLWAIVLAGNLLGAHLFAWVIARTTLVEPRMHETLALIGAEGIDAPVETTFLRAIFAGWLIALMVWMLPAARSAQFFIVLVMTWLVGAAGLAHIIAGSVDVLYLVFAGDLTWAGYAGRFFAPALAGNIIGGTLLVAALNHAQVVGGREAPDPGEQR